MRRCRCQRAAVLRGEAGTDLHRVFGGRAQLAASGGIAREILRVEPAPAAIRRWRDRHRHLAGVALHAPERHDITIEREHDLALRSEEHTSELQSLMRISYAVFCLKKTNKHKHTAHT